VPLIQEHCLRCHGPERPKGRLRLDNKADAMKGGSSGVVIEPGNAGASELYRRITLPKDDADIMPSDGEVLSKEQTDLFKAWIDQGAQWPDDFVIKEATEQPAVAAGAPHVTIPDPVLPDDFTPSAAETAALK